MQETKLCYILPFFDITTDSHYFHLYDFINEAGKNLDIILIIEKSSSDISFFENVSKIHIQKFSFFPLRILENFWLILLARIKGYRKFYIHYSYISAINSSIICDLTGAKNWYWNCGMMWLFKKDRFNQLLLKITLKLVDHLVTGVNALALGYSKNYNIPLKKIKIMPNWIDLNRFHNNFDTIKLKDKYNIPKDKKIILFVHRLAERKGIQYVIPTAKLLDDSYHFLIAGDGPYRSTLEKTITDERLKNIQILGRISNAFMPELMILADVFYMPSEEEGFPRVLIECMASGLPYVASDIGGVLEISPPVQKNYVHEVGNINSFAKSLGIITENGKNIYSEALKEKAQEYSQNNVLNIFIALFKQSK